MSVEIQDAGGVGTLTMGALFWSIEKLTLADVNDYLITFTTVGGLVWMIYKIINSRLDAKIKRKQLEKDIEDSRK